MLTTSLHLWGHITVEGVYPDGTRRLLWETPNLIVNSGLTVATELFGQLLATTPAPNASYNAIASLYVGGRTTGSSSTAGATAPASTQTSLQGTLVQRLPIASTGITYNTSPISVDFRTTLGTSQGNGYDLQEVALFTAGTNAAAPDTAAAGTPAPRMFARQVIPVLAKTSALALDFTWRIGLSAS